MIWYYITHNSLYIIKHPNHTNMIINVNHI